jgi:predicted dehydrogenase/threonine dehydrogenase-like Zn-dependent dehydrogenase
MKQVLQSLESGRVWSEEVPAPRPQAGQVLIQTRRSLVSSGTERMLLEFGRMNLFDKARSQPEKVRQVIDKVRTDGVVSTYEAVAAKLDQPLALGYSCVGVAVELGAGVAGISVGDRVMCNGKHAELTIAAQNLCARIPNGVSDDAAAFTVLAAIGLQGIRLVEPTLGECVAVTGLGLIGLLTVQLLRAQGCRVLGLDFDPARLALGARFGAEVVDLSQEEPLARARAFSRGRGVDAVLITASTDSSDPVRQGAHMCRQRGRVVLVGVSGLALERADFYEKELSFRVSCSYGPGRYDPAYEQAGHDYPVGFVRWTEQRNFEAVLDLMAQGSLDVLPLVSHRFPIERAEAAYDLLASAGSSLGILLEYAAGAAPLEPGARAAGGLANGAPTNGSAFARTVSLGAAVAAGRARVAFVGTGNYAGRILIPAFKAAGAVLHTAVSELGVSAVHYGRKFGFARASTDVEALLADPNVDTVVIATRHSSHARLALAALRSGKQVFVEKPLCTRLDELAEFEQLLTAEGPSPRLMVGYNRRFAPHVIKLKELLAPLAGPRAFVMTINAGALPAGHWVVDPAVGGGRIVGEACHFIDLLRHLAGSPIVEHAVRGVTRSISEGGVAHAGAERAPPLGADLSITLGFADGSHGTIHYLSSGHRGFPKERLEVFCAGRVLSLDNFRSLRGWGFSGFSRLRSLQQDKGQLGCARAFVGAIQSGCPMPIAACELLEVSRVSILAQQAVLP